MSIKPPVVTLLLAVAAASFGAGAQPAPQPTTSGSLAPAGQGPGSGTGTSEASGGSSKSRARVKAQTRQAGAAGTLQPAGEAPDPIGGSATPQPAHKRMAHHHGHRANVKHGMAAKHATRPLHTAAPAPDPMTEPKK